MFYGRFKIRHFAEALRCYGERRETEPAEPVNNTPGTIEEVPMGYGAIGPDHILTLLYQDIFEARDAFVNLNPLSLEGRQFWGILVDTSHRKASQAWVLARDFANWLDDLYQSKERLQFEDATYSVLLDGGLYSRLRPIGYAVLKILAFDNRGYTQAESIVACLNLQRGCIP